MAFLWILLIACATYIVTITLVVVGQELSAWLSIALFALIVFASVVLFRYRVTRL